MPQFDDTEHLLQQANDSVYGLAAGSWTADSKRAWRVAHRLDVGKMAIQLTITSVLNVHRNTRKMIFAEMLWRR